ncbi:hypothetical protein A3C89_04250 [Candidatus Kaiserbacteria bacterium RIFCSPHIGHO2_02_FULL_50_50]|uniref:Uncharacterized protein n=1 Tax=Candidatus Kaiserbacteria bacterium RIFCSPHIGHO2_02_FULL_50_50 TaxID=1798492 RepID=A0A1F6DDH8_9BACT|nr:MAG: hypothetical protein A3C89_04250 [Candidatus Kaiserbacteria bacterium RIFCSPHIGHO2_02_FULL_50_50]OGG89058.1 MAG: hypothetical protein A3G62_03970 [Candidatus Kaiserbacteria bacterium RIFCSPLOWO2_12_FULL_50_10]
MYRSSGSRLFSSFLLGILIASASFVSAEEQSSAVTVTIDNAPPQVTSIALSSAPYGNPEYAGGITPNVGTTTFHITGVVLDPNGENNIATTSAVFYRTDLAATSSCSAFLKNCYRALCTIDTAYGSSAEARYTCPIELASWADATGEGGAYASSSWTAYVAASDLTGTAGNATETTEVNSLLALTVPGDFDYGELAIGATTTAANAVEMIIAQGGNTAATIAVRGTSLACSVAGSIPVENQHWSLDRAAWDASESFSLATTATSTELHLARRVSESLIATSSLFFTLKIPDTGVGGTCTGLIYVDALASTNVGTLIDSRVKGVRYASKKRADGVTNGDGVFVRLPDDTVTFSIGSAVLGSISRNGATQSEFIFPQDLVGVARSNVTDARVTRIARFLQSLDEDQDVSNGIQISDAVHAAIKRRNLNIQTAKDADLQKAVRDAYKGRNLVSAAAAQAHLLETTKLFDPEAFD